MSRQLDMELSKTKSVLDRTKAVSWIMDMELSKTKSVLIGPEPSVGYSSHTDEDKTLKVCWIGQKPSVGYSKGVLDRTVGQR